MKGIFEGPVFRNNFQQFVSEHMLWVRHTNSSCCASHDRQQNVLRLLAQVENDLSLNSQQLRWTERIYARIFVYVHS